jgi:hypothetical protein
MQAKFFVPCENGDDDDDDIIIIIIIIIIIRNMACFRYINVNTVHKGDNKDDDDIDDDDNNNNKQ